ncbi:gentisate 1,2-dioxygenase [Noviherbaspirillum humi]|uniref:Gentisate 1,2-dioxygenase n=1 Tax=Noviherbaspirillum humi TaxID=1688639 RepID=A0A239F739_9BURK|nr:cupin domain-containing protein [Noviherbaspirillum humi]SNS51982.1 gentisate 1,2-dioxygenase [Noviherbaspirillum humi]
MTSSLGRVEDLPVDYVDGLKSRNLLPLWPALRAVLPYGKPSRKTLPQLWKYADVRPNLMLAGELTPIEKAERRVLVLCNPGLGLENMQATPSIYIGLQLILPGENAPNHKHTPSAVRFVVEGRGGYTVVNGEKLPMEKGDLILTPPGLWHQHGHDGTDPVIWLDALDLPLVYGLEASYATEAPLQDITDPHNSSVSRFRQGGVVPYASLARQRADYPLLRFPWKEVRQTLADIARTTPLGQPVHVAYVNPETGQECLPTLGFSALMLRPGEEVRLPRRSASAVLHVVEGEGNAFIDDMACGFAQADTMAVPTHAELRLSNASNKEPAFLFMVDDAPLHRKLGFYEVFA